jgi:hypothetical protein
MENRNINQLYNVLSDYNSEISILKNKTSKILNVFLSKDRSYWSENTKELEIIINELSDINLDIKCLDKCRNDSIIELSYE